MTDLRKRMLEELQRRNFSPTTIRTYLRVVEDFARYFGTRPDRLSQQHLRQYQLHLIQERKLAIKTVGLHIAALRFFFVKTLRRPYLKLDLPYPKMPKRLPTVLSKEEVTQLIGSANNLLDYTMLMTLYATGMESSPFLVETLHGSRWVMQPSSSISSTSSPQFSALAGGLRGALEDDGSRSPSSGAVRCR